MGHSRYSTSELKQHFASGVNNAETITGQYVGASNSVHGYLRDFHGTFTTFDPAGSIFTEALSINKAGAVTGSYEHGSHTWHGFVRAADGSITSFDAPNASRTEPLAINNAGEIAGAYDAGQSATYGSIRMPNGTIVTVDPDGSSYAVAYGICNDGTVTGSYGDNFPRGFILHADGTVKTFGVKNAVGTFPSAISGKGSVTGYFYGNDELAHGYVRTR